ncbi:MAG: hypothetical protein HC866_16840 [Leptolyngbyaceae cyanobacterium RU_5_1]|nr:hypothetical protein [Leptolyngbyaceae cyanobacterium RU_5_1]
MSRVGYTIKRRPFSSPVQVHRPVELCGSSLLFEVQPFTLFHPYDERLATLASADFCSIMTGVATLHAACIPLGFCGVSIRFQIALSPTPIGSQTAS